MNHAYQLVGSRTIIIGARLQGTAEEARKVRKNYKNSAQGRTAKIQSKKLHNTR